MDEGEVATAILSVTQITMRVDDREKVRRLARECNDYSAKLVADHRGRFGMFTALPMPDVDGCLKEIEYGFDVLKADGVGLYTSYRDKWLGDPAFDPIFAELDRRKAVIYVHPATPDCCVNLVPGIQDANIEYGTDTTRAIARMIFGGAAQRFPNIRIIWSHAGGTMPFLIERFMRTSTFPEWRKKLPGGFLPEAQRFYLRHGAGLERRRALMRAAGDPGLAFRLRHGLPLSRREGACRRAAPIRRLRQLGAARHRPHQPHRHPAAIRDRQAGRCDGTEVVNYGPVEFTVIANSFDKRWSEAIQSLETDWIASSLRFSQ